MPPSGSVIALSGSDSFVGGMTVAPSPPIQPSQLECDYDQDPTILYQAIEAKQWEYALSLFRAEDRENQSATWVVRKETNGKLRWRLLPLHAAVIFGAPLKLVELILTDYPAASQCKDDQGMLPLHLAFRNESNWEIIEELLTAFPQAIFVSDRKGRTPLQCGARSISSSGSIGSAPKSSKNAPSFINPEAKSFRSVVSVLDLYSQIAVSGERNRAQQESRKAMETQIGQMQDSHLATLTSLKREWNTQQEETKKHVQDLDNQRHELESKVKSQIIALSLAQSTEEDLANKLREVTVALNEANEKAKAHDQKTPLVDHFQKTNEVLRNMVTDLVQQQKAYHTQCTNLMTKYEKLLEERKQIQAIFAKDSKSAASREAAVVHEFKTWLNERETRLSEQQISLEEEKKVEDVLGFVGRTTEDPSRSATKPQASKTKKPAGGASKEPTASNSSNSNKKKKVVASASSESASQGSKREAS